MKREIDIVSILLSLGIIFNSIGDIAASKRIDNLEQKIADLSEENVVSINVSTDEEKSLVEENRGVVGALESVLPEESYVEPVKTEEPDWIEYVVTAYCGCRECVGKWHTEGYTLTASGWGAQAGVTIAADESYPFGTVLYLEGLGERVVMDRGSAIVGNHLDLYFDTHEEACEWGMRTVRGYVVEASK